MKIAKVASAAAVVTAVLAGPALGQTVFVSNEKDNTLSVIDAGTLQVTKTIKVGRRPRGITLNADGSLLYICASDDDTVQVLDVATGKILHDLPRARTRSSSRSIPTASICSSPTRTTTS